MNGLQGPRLPRGEYFLNTVTTPSEDEIKSHFADTQKGRRIAGQVAQLADISAEIPELFDSIELRIQRIAQICFDGRMRSAIEQTQTIFDALFPDPIQNSYAVTKWHEYTVTEHGIETNFEIPRKTKIALQKPVINRGRREVDRVIDFVEFKRRKENSMLHDDT